MKRKGIMIIVALVGTVMAAAQDNIRDSVDVLRYDLRLDIGNRTENRIEGSAAVTMAVLRAVDSLRLELMPSDVDSVWIDGVATRYCYDPSRRLLSVPYGGVGGDTTTMTVFYRKGPHVMPQNWGGFYFENDIYYNLGIAIYEYPHNAGKCWFPCRDNFYDKARYHFEITARPGWKAICSGVMDTVEYHADGSSTWCWSLERPTPTYLVGVAVAPFTVIEREYDGEYGTYPAMIGFVGHDSARVWKVYERMSKVIPELERCFGPYRWDRVGYVSTQRGSMEHASNVAFVSDCMSSTQEGCLATMSHEFAHAWFGNLVTCASSADMWINEGGASFCEELSVGAIYDATNPGRGREYARENLAKVLLQTHVDDGGFRPLYGPSSAYTYGSTVYKKGATVWHSLRGHIGEAPFYAAMRTLFDRCAFQNITTQALRDSLELYSGVDLHGFFDFHVYGKGFVDYEIDSMSVSHASTAVYLRQKTYGADTFANGNRVWLTFFSPEMKSVKRLVAFDGETTRAVCPLPFAPAFAVVDYDDELSKASLGDALTVDAAGEYTLSGAMSKIVVGDGADDGWLYVKHHWTRPDASDAAWVKRMATRHWTVTGLLPTDRSVEGHFRFSRVGGDNTLDQELLYSSGDLKSLRLLYRPGAGTAWRVVESTRTGSGLQGYLVDASLKKGEYTLAIVDTTLLGVVDAGEWQERGVRVYPNPTGGKVRVESDIVGEQLDVEVVDMRGVAVARVAGHRSGDELPQLFEPGVYLFRVARRDGGATTSVKVSVAGKK